MPAMLEDPTAPRIFRTSGENPPCGPITQLPPDIFPYPITLRDRTTIATLIPYNDPSDVPPNLMAHLCQILNREIEKGDTYPMMDQFTLEKFGPYWFANFGAIMILGDIMGGIDEIKQMEFEGRANWAKDCLGSFYIKPNYPGRSSHVCNGGFLVTDAARNRGVGKSMGEGYLEWAPKLGYTYSVFNLVYETNVASCKIWDGLGFKRIGKVPKCGNLKSSPDEYVDAIIYGRVLGSDDSDTVTEERFEKIKYYLKNGKYPNGADRAEKSRLRSAATHYKLFPATETDPERLMLKDKEVISEPSKQYELARHMHLQHHGGINKTTASIAEKYHWVRIKDTVSQVIKNCPDCRDTSKQPPSATRQDKNGSNGNISVPPTPAPVMQQQQQTQPPPPPPQEQPQQVLQLQPLPEPTMMETLHYAPTQPDLLAVAADQLPSPDQQIMLQGMQDMANYSTIVPVDPSIANSLAEAMPGMHSDPSITMQTDGSIPIHPDSTMPIHGTAIPLHTMNVDFSSFAGAAGVLPGYGTAGQVVGVGGSMPGYQVQMDLGQPHAQHQLDLGQPAINYGQLEPMSVQQHQGTQFDANGQPMDADMKNAVWQ